MVFNSFAAGKKVYGQGSYAPTRGRVSAQGAQGYLQREIRKPQSPLQPGVSKVGGDGQSDTRSGVAAGMLANKTTGPSGPIRPPGGVDPDLPNSGQGPGGVQTPDGNNGHPTSPPVGAPPPTAPGGGGTPTVEINADGTLSLPYDSAWSQSVMSGLQSMNSQLMDLQFESQDQAMQYARANRDADIEYGDVKRGTLGANAQGGTAFSSQYGTSVGENARAYGNYKNDLLMDNNMFNQRTAYERLAIQNAFNEMLRQDVITRGENAVAGGASIPGGAPGGGNGGGNGGGGNGNGGGGRTPGVGHHPNHHGPKPTPRDPQMPHHEPKGPKGPKGTKRNPGKNGPKKGPDTGDPGGPGPNKKSSAQANAQAYLRRKAK